MEVKKIVHREELEQLKFELWRTFAVSQENVSGQVETTSAAELAVSLNYSLYDTIIFVLKNGGTVARFNKATNQIEIFVA